MTSTQFYDEEKNYIRFAKLSFSIAIFFINIIFPEHYSEENEAERRKRRRKVTV
jgi:hypothetical protein